MELIYKEVASRLGISKDEVEVIYRDYATLVRKEMVLNPHREIYLEKFGKFTPSIFKIKRKLRTAFYKRNLEKVQLFIKTLRHLNYKPKQ